MSASRVKGGDKSYPESTFGGRADYVSTFLITYLFHIRMSTLDQEVLTSKTSAKQNRTTATAWIKVSRSGEKFWSKFQRWGLTDVKRKKAIASVALSPHLRSPPSPFPFCLNSLLLFRLSFPSACSSSLALVVFSGPACLSNSKYPRYLTQIPFYLTARREKGVCLCVHVRGRAYSPVTFCPSEWTHIHRHTRTHTPSQRQPPCLR